MSIKSAAERRFDVIVIGSGIGGLTAALTVATRGRRVLLLEAGKQFGGYLNPFQRRAYSFDPGLHYIGECGPHGAFTKILESLGIADDVRFRELTPDGFDRIVFPGYEVYMPKGADRYHQRLLADFPHERRGLEKFFDLLRRMREALPAINSIRGLRSAIAASRHLPFLLRYVRSTFGEMLDSIISDPLLKGVLAAQGGDVGLPPGKASALLSLGLLNHYLDGAYFPIGGSRAVRDAFVKGIEKKGGTALRNSPVSRILLSGDRVSGVRCKNGDEYQAPIVISNADAVVTYRDLIGTANLPSSLRKKTQSTRHSIASMCMFVGTDIDVAKAGMTDANIWNYPHVDIDRAYAHVLRGEMPPNDFFFLSSPSLKDPISGVKAPPGHHTLEFVTLAPFEPFARWEDTKTKKRGDDYEKMKRELETRYLTAIEKYVPGLREHITVLELGTPVTNVTYAAAPYGSIYGPEQSPNQMTPFRFGTRGAIDGLYMCGSSVLGAGIVPCAVSGNVAGKMAVRDAQSKR